MALDPELKRALDEVRALTKDNHRMLRAIRRDQWLSFIGKIIIWLIILAVPFYLYQHYLRPIVSAITPSSTASSTSGGFLGLPSSAQLKNLVHSLGTGSAQGK